MQVSEVYFDILIHSWMFCTENSAQARIIGDGRKSALKSRATNTEEQGIFLSIPTTASRRGSAILFHGITGDPEEMEDLAHFLNDRGFEVFAPRLSGHGESIEQLRRTPTQAWLDDVEAALERMPPDEPVLSVGLSFGALLALNAGIVSPKNVKGIVAMSPPMKFENSFRETLLSWLYLLPDIILNRLGVVKKKKRRDNIFLRQRKAFDKHSIGATARLVQIRLAVLAKLPSIECPILVLQDPEDHHLSKESPEIISNRATSSEVTTQWFLGGQHELTIGPKQAEVFAAIEDFANLVIPIRHNISNLQVEQPKGEGGA